jgi:predicted transcriptional regulator
MSDPKQPGVEEGSAQFEADLDAPLPLSEEEEAALLEAEADADAGRVVPHSEVRKWLLTWGTPDEGPPPKSWFE